MKKYLLTILLLIFPLLTFAQVNRVVKQFEHVEQDLKKAGVVPGNPCDKANVSRPKVELSTVIDAKGNQIDISLVSKEYAKELFDEMAAQKHIPFDYPQDGCYARAHEMSRLLEKKGVITTKVFVEGDLRVATKNSPNGYVEWWYHVAPIIKVRDGDKEELYVFDPSIFDRPVTIKEWTEIQTKHSPDQQESVYSTRRFNYYPMSKYEDLADYRPEDLINTEETMRMYRHIVQNNKTIAK